MATYSYEVIYLLTNGIECGIQIIFFAKAIIHPEYLNYKATACSR
jgi:hypothetical protein